MRGPDAVARCRDLLASARRVVVLTGAGISAESGVPTFRDADGIWATYRPEEVATPQAFARDPRFVWEWYALRRDVITRCQPNAAHHAIARLQAQRPDTILATQNVDGLHVVAGNSVGAPPPIELHGSLFRARCTRCDWRAEHREPIDASSADALPRCPVCDALARPDVVWFGEALPVEAIERATTAAERADVCLVVGTSSLVYPAAGLPHLVLDQGGAVIEVNPEPTPLTSHATLSLREKAAAALPELLRD